MHDDSNKTKQIVATNIRLARGPLTRPAFGALIGVDQMQIYKWERAIHRPSDEHLEELAVVLKRKLAWFYTPHQIAA